MDRKNAAVSSDENLIDFSGVLCDNSHPFSAKVVFCKNT